VKSYIFPVELSEEGDGRWNAVVPLLTACYTWGNTREEALVFIQDAVRCCVEDMLAHGEPIPEGVQVIDEPVTSVVI
jgi:predicted RNase H-like HicB family nuclease